MDKIDYFSLIFVLLIQNLMFVFLERRKMIMLILINKQKNSYINCYHKYTQILNLTINDL